MSDTIGDAFMRPLMQGIRAGQAQQRMNQQNRIAEERLSQQGELGNARLQNQKMIGQIRLMMLQKQLGMMRQNQAIQLANLAMRKQDFAEKVREFDANQKNKPSSGSIQNFRDNKLKMSGLPFQRETSNGSTGLYRMPTGAEATGLEKVVDAYPQLYTAMNQIGQGAKYMHSNAPGDIQKYSTSIISYMAGNATPKQEKILEESGISLDSLAQAAETATRVMNIPKTNEGMEAAFGMFTPRKGDTAQSYKARLNNSINNFSERYWQAQYQLQGIPLADASASGDQNASIDDMKNFVKSKKGKMDILGSSDNDSETNSENIKTDSGNTVPKYVVKAYAKKYGISDEEAENHIKESM